MAISDLRALTYDPLEWEDRVVDQGTGQVLVEGTPVNEVNLNRLEAGVMVAHLDIGTLAGMLASLIGQHRVELDKWLRQRIVTGTATISGQASGPGTYFRASDPFVDVAFPATVIPQINAPNYAVLLEVISASDPGAVGQLIVSNKAQNGFRITMTGSAASVTVRWIVINPVL